MVVFDNLETINLINFGLNIVDLGTRILPVMSLSPNQALVLGKNDERSFIKPISHYVLGLRFGNLKRSKTQEKTQPARVFTTRSVIWKTILVFFSRWVIFSRVIRPLLLVLCIYKDQFYK